MMKIIAIPFGWILKLAYMLVKNYGVALFLFTVVINLIMLPSRIKQQKDSAKMARLKPKLDQIQKKYANNRDKLNEATMELYNQENVSPMGSCLPLIITYVILFAIIEVVYAPMTYISNLTPEKITAASQTVVDYYRVAKEVADDTTDEDPVAKTLAERVAAGESIEEIITGYNESLGFTDERLAEIISSFEANQGLDEYFNDNQKVSSRLLAGGSTNRAQLIVLSVADDYPQLFDSEIVQFCEDFNYTFLGLYLGRYPSWSTIYIIIPIISLLSQLCLMFLSQYFMKKNGQNTQQGKGMMTMLYLMPLLSFWIAFSFPAGIGIYWIFSAVVQLVQTVCINLYFTPARLDKILAKDAKKTRRPSLYQMALEQQRAQNGGAAPEGSLLDDDDEDRKLTKNERKELERQKINEARKRLVEDEEDVDPRVLEARRKMAEKYGDDY